MYLENTSTIRILVACHKDDINIRQDDIHTPIHVGKALNPNLDLGFQGDDTGDNISNQNDSYCELTAIYWAWKNFKDIDYIGLCHYRRYFNGEITKYTIPKYLEKYDIIVPKFDSLTHSNLESLFRFIGMEDTYIMLDTILTLYPDIKDALIKYFYNSNKLTVFNMSIMKKNLFEEYCIFLFSILDETSKKLKGHNYTRQKRNLGYMGESLLGLFILYKKLKVKQVKVDRLDLNLNKKAKVIQNIKKKIATITFKINNYPKFQQAGIWPAIKVGLKNDGISLKNF